MVQHTKSYSQAQLAQDHSVDDTFQLFDLRVEVVIPAASSPPGDPVKLMCGAKVGDHFELKGEMLYLPPGQGMSIYSIASVLPLLAAKQRQTHANDWMESDAEVACPDPNCPSRLRIARVGLRTFSHGETTVVPLPAAQAVDQTPTALE